MSSFALFDEVKPLACCSFVGSGFSILEAPGGSDLLGFCL